MNNLLHDAIEYEKREEQKIEKSSRPLFHLSSRVGWMNDPNGFSYYDGKYHLFYQYYPYDNQWGPMHWGHAVSEDLMSWTYLPVALSPDQAYDHVGCFSGSAIELSNGEHLIIYTGVRKEGENDKAKDIQTQCIAVGDGSTYKKYDANPVISEAVLPQGCSRYDFRDPKIWNEDGRYYCVVGNCSEDKDGQILLFSSTNGLEWKFEKILIKNNHRFGKMWECPDFFELDGKRVLIISPQEMLPVGLEFDTGNGTLYIVGEFDEDLNYKEESYGTIDYGIDFYAPQTLLAPDGRRIMIGWMQNWDTLSYKPEFSWFGQMSIPREISIIDGKMIQRPIREIQNYYGEKSTHSDVLVSNKASLPGIEGRCIDLELSIRPAELERMYKKFEIHFADNGREYSSISYDPYDSIIKIDRKYSGTRKVTIHQKQCYVRKNNGELKLRLILDRFSIEAFINDGEQVMSMTLYTDISAKEINFLVDGEIYLDAVMHELEIGER